MEHNSGDIFHALADPSRREILALLSGRQLAAGQIARRFPQRRPAISKHLSLLKRAGLLAETRQAQRRLYSVRPEALEPVIRLLAGLKSDSSRSRVKKVSPTPPVREVRATPPVRKLPVFDLEFD